MSKITRFLKTDFFNKKIMIQLVFYPIFQKYRYKYIGKHSCIYKPICVTGKECISLGSRSHIMNFARIEMIKEWQGDDGYAPELIIGDDVHCGQGLHLVCAERIEIGSGTTISANVCIIDNEHDYTCGLDCNVLNFPLKTKSIKIGKNCLLGIDSVVLSGVTIGDNVIVGAHSVVTKDVPSYSVVVGCPAKVVKKYDFELNEWVKVTD